MLFPEFNGCLQQTYVEISDISIGAELPKIESVHTGISQSEWMPIEAVSDSRPTMPILIEHARGTFARPDLRGCRISPPDQIGASWSTKFIVDRNPAVSNKKLIIHATDPDAELSLTIEMESLIGGSLRIRHMVQNESNYAYFLQGLDVSIPIDDDQTIILDYTGRHERERQPQLHAIGDGIWLREYRWGKPGFDGPAMAVGTKNFDFCHGKILLVQPAWSGNSELYVQRGSNQPPTISAGELLLPGEKTLSKGESYITPWVVVTLSSEGLNGLSQSLHQWQRSLPSHPKTEPVTLNVWEGVQFNHDFSKLKSIAKIAADLGVERYVLDDGWFHSRRNDKSGLGDWWVDPLVWPNGLSPIIDVVHNLGMEFGLWFEPEMINPDSDLYRRHPDWVMQAADRTPELERNQMVLDLTNPKAFDYVYQSMKAILSRYRIDSVKWDHNRFLLEAGSSQKSYAPAVHEQTIAYYKLLIQLSRDFPYIDWESCASGGSRIDMNIIEKVQRFWGSDVTDALSRQLIQRWTALIIAPEYLGAHVSQTTSLQTGRTYSLDFRAATAVFFSFGIEWDVTRASRQELDQLKRWIEWYKKERHFLHTGRFVSLDVTDPSILAYAVVSDDGSRAVIEHVQYEESSSERGSFIRVPYLKKDAQYVVRWIGPVKAQWALGELPQEGPCGCAKILGKDIGCKGIWLPRCRPETVRMIEISDSCK